MSTPNPVTSKVVQAIGFAHGMAEEARGGVASMEGFSATLAAGEVTGRPLKLASAAQELYAQIAAVFDQLHADLDRHRIIAEAYAATGNDAGSKAFLESDGIREDGLVAAANKTPSTYAGDRGFHTPRGDLRHQDSPSHDPATGSSDMAQPENTSRFTPVPFEEPPPEVLETGPFAQHKLPDPTEDQEFREMIAEFFDPMQDKDPRLLKSVLDNGPADKRDVWTRRADEIAHAWGSSLHGPGGLFEYIGPAGAGTGSGDPDAGESSAGHLDAEMPPVAQAEPVLGRLSNKPLAANGWGFDPNTTVHYHDDGPVGIAIRYMGREARLDVDGEPLANVMGKVATEVVRGRRTAQQAVDDLKVLRDRLPESSQARTCLGMAIDQMDAPASPVPAVPEGTPEPLRRLVQALHAVPIVRKEPEKELQPLLALADDFAAGRIRQYRLAEGVRNLRNKRHESYGDAGKFEIDRAIDAAATALREQRR